MYVALALVIPPLGMDTIEIIRYAHKDLWVMMFIVLLFLMKKKKTKISKCFSNEGLLKKLWSIYTLDYWPAIFSRNSIQLLNDSNTKCFQIIKNNFMGKDVR